MANPINTGPVHIWPVLRSVATPAANATVAGLVGVAASILGAGTAAGQAAIPVLAGGNRPYYLGTSMRGVRIRIRRAYSRVWNDLSGPEIAFDKLWAGCEAMVFLDLTRWNENIYQGLIGADLEGPGARGSLMMTEGVAFPVILRFPAFDFHPIFRGTGGGACYRFLAASPEGEEDWETGTGANIRHLMLHCQQIYDPRSNGFMLRDFNPMGLPPTAPN